MQLYRIVHIVIDGGFVPHIYIYTCTTFINACRMFLKVLSIFWVLGGIWLLLFFFFFFFSVCWGQHLCRVCTNKFFSKTLILWWTWITLGIVLPHKEFLPLRVYWQNFDVLSTRQYTIKAKNLCECACSWTFTCFGFGLDLFCKQS